MKKYEKPSINLELIKINDDMLLVSFNDTGHDILDFDEEDNPELISEDMLQERKKQERVTQGQVEKDYLAKENN